MSLERVLAEVLPELQREDGVQAIFLTGSVARGEADEFSDLDLSVLVESDDLVHNTVSYRNGVLLSVERSTAAHRARAFTEPEAALWNLVSLQTGRALHDPHGIYADLQARARAVRWAGLAAHADARAAELLADNAEELHKVMGGLSAGDGAKVAYACLGLTLALGKVALLSAGTPLPSENVFLDRARDAWADAKWASAYGVLAGLEGGNVWARGHAALSAYFRAVVSIRWTDGPERELAHGAAARAAAVRTLAGAPRT
ncbi:nucleotidyltransferase domain-containing protein [Deinococcus frigens]|uniref:nucleotidyltransferase domain-containing protein n=1 Tax=Deinococcus frigens TaxID=249403 RepID=UPI000497434F|nr:nucleotidyltransferase domain-containing protein [Deinococcus frigens]